MQGWHTTFLGMRGLPRDISDFEMKAFFTLDGAERDAINARRGDSHKLGLALHIGFLRMSGRLLGAFRVIPVALWRHLGNELGIAAPEVASLRAMYERGRTLFDHQQVACTVLGFQWMSEHQRRSLVRELRDEVARCADRDQLLVRARQWLYKNKLVIVHERAIRTLIAAALAQLEVETGTAIAASVDPATLDRWRASVSELRPDGQTQQSWLWAAPAKHSTRQISEVLERIDLLYTLDVHKHLADIPDLILRRYARRLVSRPPSAGAKIKEPARTVEVACFLRYCLFTTTDQLILMVQRRIADLWRQAAADVPATVNWAAMYKTLLGELVALSAQGAVPDAELRARLEALITETQKRKPPSRASLVREGLIDGIRPVRSLLVAIAKLPWQATGEHPQAALGELGLLRLALQRALLLTAFGQAALGLDHTVAQLGVALLAVGQLHVQFFKTRLRGDAALLQVAQLRLDLGQIGANLLAARPGLLGQLRQSQGLNLQLVRAALGLAGLAARGHQALRRVGVQALGTHQRRARLLGDQCLGTQLLMDRKFNRMRPSMARVLGLETRSAKEG